MRHISRFVLFVCGAAVPSALAVVSGQVDTFQGGTLLNWGGNASPTNVPSGGPAGAADRYLRINAAGGGLATRNTAQWAGDYLAAGVTRIAVDLRNEGSSALSMRIALFNSPGGDFTTTTALPLPADNQWHRLVFGLSAAELTYVGGAPADLSQTLANMGLLLIRHQSGAPLGSGTTSGVVGTVGLDNISATPEPATCALMSVAGVVVLRRRRARLRY